MCGNEKGGVPLRVGNANPDGKETPPMLKVVDNKEL
jgi:hypothetical protein